jgi:hypothetical protein
MVEKDDSGSKGSRPQVASTYGTHPNPDSTPVLFYSILQSIKVATTLFRWHDAERQIHFDEASPSFVWVPSSQACSFDSTRG